MAGNTTAAVHTEHFDIRYKFVNNYMDDGIVKVALVSQQKMTAIFSLRTLVEKFMQSMQAR